MKKYLLLVLVALFILGACSPAFARVPPLTQARADLRFHHDIDQWRADLDATYDPSVAPDELHCIAYGESGECEQEEYNDVITKTELDDCDLVTYRRAECDGTVWWNDGDACDITLTVITTRRNHLSTTLEIQECDQDEE